MNKKTAVIVEDQKAQREALEVALKLRGFNAEGAGTVAQARALTKRLGEKIDVLVLDMLLDDPAEANTTGADIGIEVASAQKWPPESLIVSVQDERSDFYQAALNLRAAAYLSKRVASQEDVIRHVRALALRRALTGHPDTVSRIADIAEISRDESEALERFCQKILVPELETCLGSPFIILITEGELTRKCGGTNTLPDGPHPAFSTVQSLAHGDANLSKPFLFDPTMLSEPPDLTTQNIYDRLSGASFLPLSINRNLLLSIGILEPGIESAKYKLAEDPQQLAMVLMGYFRPAVLESLLSLLSRLTEFNAERKTVLRETSRFCLYFGQEQLAILADALESGELKADSTFFRKLKTLASDLRSTGEMLLPLAIGKDKKQVTFSREHIPAVHVSDVIEEAWHDVLDRFAASDVSFKVQTDKFCDVEVGRDDLFLALSRLLQWTVQRKLNTPAGVAPAIRVTCERKDEWADIIIEDKSRRLGKALRNRLFEPFNQAMPILAGLQDDDKSSRPGLYLPLYLAKMLVEMKCHGKLDDRSDLMEGDVGHKLIMSLPLSEHKVMRTAF